MQKCIIFIVSHEKYYTSSIVCQMTIIIIYLEILKNIFFFFFDFCSKYFSYLKKNKNRLKPARLLCYDINMLLLVFARPLKIPSHTYIIISISVF